MTDRALVSKTFYVDIDSTIWPAEQHYDRAAQELYGKPFRSHWYDIPELIEEFGPDYKDLFRYALQPDLVQERTLYPHVPRVLKYLHRTLGFDIHFLTHNFEPEIFKQPLKEWLYATIKVPFDLTVVTEDHCKIEIMQQDDHAWGIAEDKPSTLIKSEAAGFVTLAKQQPWNSLTLQENPGILSFDSWEEVPSIVKGVLRFWDSWVA